MKNGDVMVIVAVGAGLWGASGIRWGEDPLDAGDYQMNNSVKLFTISGEQQ